MGHLTHYTRTKTPEQVACGTHWLEVPKEERWRRDYERLFRALTAAEREIATLRGALAHHASPGTCEDVRACAAEMLAASYRRVRPQKARARKAAARG